MNPMGTPDLSAVSLSTGNLLLLSGPHAVSPSQNRLQISKTPVAVPAVEQRELVHPPGIDARQLLAARGFEGLTLGLHQNRESGLVVPHRKEWPAATVVRANQVQHQLAIMPFTQQSRSARRHHGRRFMSRFVRIISQFS